MGKVHSLFDVTGTVGEYVFYTLNGQQIMRKKPAKKKGPKIPPHLNVQQQNSEFGRASSAGKTLRLAFAEECRSINDSYLYQRISQLMLQIKKYDPAPLGLRTVSGGLSTKEGQTLFSQFHFQKKQNNLP